MMLSPLQLHAAAAMFCTLSRHGFSVYNNYRIGLHGEGASELLGNTLKKWVDLHQ